MSTVYRVVNITLQLLLNERRTKKELCVCQTMAAAMLCFQTDLIDFCYVLNVRSFMHFLTGVCAIVGGIFTGMTSEQIYLRISIR